MPSKGFTFTTFFKCPNYRFLHNHFAYINCYILAKISIVMVGFEPTISQLQLTDSPNHSRILTSWGKNSAVYVIIFY